MPVYCYRCPACGEQYELKLPVAERAGRLCQCGAMLVQTPAPFNFRLRGEGWARDGYKGGKRGGSDD